jgi:hypothetical protein
MKALRTLLKALAWIVGGLVALVVLCYLALLAINWRDRPPSETARRFAAAYRDRPLVADTDNAFVYATGFFVAPGGDPQSAGVRRLALMNNALKDPSRNLFSTAANYDYKAARSAVVQALSDACRDGTSECLAALERDAPALAEWSSSERWLFERYLTLISRRGWRENASLDVRMTLPAYGTIVEGQRLLLVQAWMRAGEKDTATVRNLLAQDLRFWRHTLACSDILITKMIAVAALKRHFKMGDLVLRRLPAEREAAGRPAEWATEMTIPERSMMRTWVGEWVFLDTFTKQTKAGETSITRAEGPLASAWRHAWSPLLQTQDFSNQWAEAFERANAELDVPYDQYRAGVARAEAIMMASSEGGLPPIRAYNPVGAVFRWLNGTQYAGYSERVVDIEGVRRAALLASDLRSRGITAAQVRAELSASAIREPYGNEPFGWNEKKGALIFTGLERSSRGEHEIIY